MYIFYHLEIILISLGWRSFTSFNAEIANVAYPSLRNCPFLIKRLRMIMMIPIDSGGMTRSRNKMKLRFLLIFKEIERIKFFLDKRHKIRERSTFYRTLKKGDSACFFFWINSVVAFTVECCVGHARVSGKNNWNQSAFHIFCVTCRSFIYGWLTLRRKLDYFRILV